VATTFVLTRLLTGKFVRIELELALEVILEDLLKLQPALVVNEVHEYKHTQEQGIVCNPEHWQPLSFVFGEEDEANEDDIEVDDSERELFGDVMVELVLHLVSNDSHHVVTFPYVLKHFLADDDFCAVDIAVRMTALAVLHVAIEWLSAIGKKVPFLVDNLLQCGISLCEWRHFTFGAALGCQVIKDIGKHENGRCCYCNDDENAHVQELDTEINDCEGGEREAHVSNEFSDWAEYHPIHNKASHRHIQEAILLLHYKELNVQERHKPELMHNRELDFENEAKTHVSPECVHVARTSVREEQLNISRP